MEDIEKILKEETRKNFANMSYSCEGLRAIETLNEKTAENRAKKRIAKQAKTYIDLYAKMKNNDSVYYDGFKYTKQEIMMFLVWLYRDGEDGFISMSEKDDPLLFMHWEDINDALLELEKQGAKDDASVFQRLILERYKEHCEKKNKYGVVFKEILPKELYFTIFGQTPLNTQNMYNIGGVSSSIFSKLGLNNFSDKISSKRAKNVLFDEDCNSKYILTACGDTKITNKFGIIPHHGYSIEAFDVEGKRKFKIRNPQCSINEHILSYAELEKYFSDIDVGKI